MLTLRWWTLQYVATMRELLEQLSLESTPDVIPRFLAHLGFMDLHGSASKVFSVEILACWSFQFDMCRVSKATVNELSEKIEAIASSLAPQLVWMHFELYFIFDLWNGFAICPDQLNCAGRITLRVLWSLLMFVVHTASLVHKAVKITRFFGTLLWFKLKNRIFVKIVLHSY